jgi:hypothetical protein
MVEESCALSIEEDGHIEQEDALMAYVDQVLTQEQPHDIEPEFLASQEGEDKLDELALLDSYQKEPHHAWVDIVPPNEAMVKLPGIENRWKWKPFNGDPWVVEVLSETNIDGLVYEIRQRDNRKYVVSCSYSPKPSSYIVLHSATVTSMPSLFHLHRIFSLFLLELTLTQLSEPSRNSSQHQTEAKPLSSSTIKSTALHRILLT